MRIEEVQGRSGLRRFLKVPKRLHPPESNWIAPLDMERRRFFDPRKNAFLERGKIEMLIAVDEGGRDVARVAAIDNPVYNEYQGTSLGFFGFFDTPDDPEVSSALIEETAERARARGHARLHGPVSPSTNHECGLLVSGFDSLPTVMTPWNPPYYEPLLLGSGLEQVQDLVAMVLFPEGGMPERLVHAERVLRKRHPVEIRELNVKRLEEELEILRSIYNEAWADNFGFVPMSDREVRELARDLKPVIVPDLCFIAEVGGEPVGISISLPDVNLAMRPLRGSLFPFGWLKFLRGLKRIDRMRGMVLGVRPAYRKMGVDYTLLRAGFDGAINRGYSELEIAWMLADNVKILRPMERIGLHECKRYRLYEREL